MIFMMWIVFSVIVGIIGIDRSIGFFGAFLLSLFLSPVIGIIITLLSKTKMQEETEQFMHEELLRRKNQSAETQANTTVSANLSNTETTPNP